MTHEFKSEGTFQIAGRGLVKTVKLDHDIPMAELLHCDVVVDGLRYECRGIESFCIARKTPIVYSEGERIGLLVKETE